MDKNSLREQAKYHRDRLLVREEDFEIVAGLFFESLVVDANKIIAGYWPKGKEFDDRYILDDALKLGVPCALPVIEPDTKILTFKSWHAGTPLAQGTFGVMVPAEGAAAVIPDIVIVPLLAFDRRGYRLGYGGGYYDATLSHLRAQKEIIAVGLGYNEQAVLFNLPIDEHDQKLDMMITPNGVKDFRNG